MMNAGNSRLHFVILICGALLSNNSCCGLSTSTCILKSSPFIPRSHTYASLVGHSPNSFASSSNSMPTSTSLQVFPNDNYDDRQRGNGGSGRSSGSTNNDQIIARNNARLCVKSFLTQRSIQSFSYLLAECRDPHSGKWIEDFLGLQNLGNYHGTGAFDVSRYPTWDSVLLDMMRQPNDKMIVSAKRRGRGHGGWSKNNPYLEERWVEFPIDIRPASLVQRLLPVRQQLALEFQKDLQIVKIVDSMIMDSYFTKVKEDPESDHAFDRISVAILSNFTEFQESGSSPFRRGNFDLLYNLCTQASTHRLLREFKAEGKVREVSFLWLRRFYGERVKDFFDGDQPFGKADDFIDALLRTPPSLIDMDGGRSVGLTDPLMMAERIISIRSEIADEWIELMGEVKEDHLRLNDVLMRVMMGKAHESDFESSVDPPPVDDVFGAFE